MITDYDSWKTDEAHVTIEMVIEYLQRNAATAKQIVTRVIPGIPREPNWPCHSALKNAILTDRKLWPAKTRKELALLLARED
jgi:5'-methylthioadenosine phosphorylase